jgi:hypothetical protein
VLLYHITFLLFYSAYRKPPNKPWAFMDGLTHGGGAFLDGLTHGGGGGEIF